MAGWSASWAVTAPQWSSKISDRPPTTTPIGTSWIDLSIRLLLDMLVDDA
jgi:hypothetical protein